MRILHLDFDNLAHPWSGGQARRTFEINRRLAAQYGWEITVVTGGASGVRRPAGGPLGTATDRWPAYHSVGGGPFPLDVLSFLAALPMVVRRMPHDLVVEDFTAPIGPALAPKWTAQPVIGSAQFLFARQMARKYHLPFDRVERRALHSYRWFIALAESGAAHLRQAAPLAEIAVIPQGVEAASLVPFDTIDGSGAHALFLGRLDVHQKGLDTLLHAWAALPPDRRAPLMIAGEGRDRARVAALTLQLGLEQTVRLVGHVQGGAKRNLLQQARIVCMPSRYETYGISALEAQAAGKPLVATAVPGLAEAAGAGAILVPPDDPHALAEAVGKLWDNRDLRVDLGTAGRTAVRGRTWEHVSRAQAEFYARVIAHHT